MTRLWERLRDALTWLVRLPILIYRYAISPWIPPRCRYFPSCSSYALEAIDEHGPVHGTYLTLRRIGRCHPWCEGGYDPVPPNPARNQQQAKSSE